MVSLNVIEVRLRELSVVHNKMLDNALKLAQKKAANSRDGELRYKGKVYTLKFNQRDWTYRVEEDGEFLLNFNVRGLTKAKSELKKWLDT